MTKTRTAPTLTVLIAALVEKDSMEMEYLVKVLPCENDVLILYQFEPGNWEIYIANDLTDLDECSDHVEQRSTFRR